MLSYVEALEQAGVALPESAKKHLEKAQQAAIAEERAKAEAEAVAKLEAVKGKISAAVAGILKKAGVDLGQRRLVLSSNGEDNTLKTAIIGGPRPGGNGDGKAFGGGGGTKDRRPIKDETTGIVYKNVHDAVVGTGLHECAEEHGTAQCGYWKVWVDNRDSGRFSRVG